MNDDELRRTLEAKLHEQPPPAFERLQTFLVGYVHSSDRDMLKRMSTKFPADFVDAVEAIETVLLTTLPPGTLHSLVTVDGNRMLPEDTDTAAAAWLRTLAEDLRRWLGDLGPPARSRP